MNRFLLLILCIAGLIGMSGACAATKVDPEEAQRLNSEGVDLAQRGELPQAIEKFSEALDLFRRAHDERGEMKAMANLAAAFSQVERYDEALSYGSRVRDLAHSLGETTTEANVLFTLAKIHQTLGQHEETVRLAEQALPLVEAEGDARRLAALLQFLGDAERQVGRNERAIAFLQRSLPLWKQAADPFNEAMTLGLMAAIRALQLDWEQSLRLNEEADALLRQSEHKAEEGPVLRVIAFTALDLGQPVKALAALQRELSIWQELGDLSKQAEVWNALGVYHEALHKYQDARAAHERALEIQSQRKDRAAQAQTYLQIGTSLDLLEDWESAVKANQLALSLFEELADRRGKGEALTAIGSLYRRNGRSSDALPFLEQALEIWQELQNRPKEIHVLSRLAVLYSLAGDAPRRAALQQRARQLLPDADEMYRPVLLESSALIDIAEGDFAQARNGFQAALELYRAHGEPWNEADALVGIGNTFLLEADPVRALETYRQAIATLERLRFSSVVRDLRTGVANHAASAYEKAVQAALSLQRPEEAFELTERSRARELVAAMAGLHLEGKTPAAGELLRQERALRIELDRLGQRLVEGIPASEIEGLKTRLADRQSVHEELLGRIQSADPRAASLLGGGAPPTLRSVQEHLSPDTTILSYFKTAPRVLAFVVTRDAIEVVELPVTGKELEDMGRKLASASEGQGEPKTLGSLYDQLSHRLIEPVRDRLRTPRIGIIPHAELHHVPFAALRKDERYLGESHVLFELPSASALLFSTRPQGPLPKRLFALGYPAIEMSAETETVATSFGGTALIGPNATKSALLTRSREYQILHLAAHARFNRVAPLLSSIALAPEAGSVGSLELQEVYNLDLSGTDLVVLSACESGFGAWTQGDELTALGRGFMHAGARAVIASLWKADNEATTVLMKAFYRHLKAGEGKGKALQSAQEETRRAGFKDPRYWAGFVLTGDPG